MTGITIRNLGDDAKRRLCLRAARHNRSMEEEARSILRAALAGGQSPTGDLARSIQSRFSALGGVNLETPPREPVQEPPRFD